MPSARRKGKYEGPSREHQPAKQRCVKSRLRSSLGHVALIQSLLIQIGQVAECASYDDGEEDETDLSLGEAVVCLEDERDGTEGEVHETPCEGHPKRKRSDDGFGAEEIWVESVNIMKRASGPRYALTNGPRQGNTDQNRQRRPLGVRTTLIPLIARLLPEFRRPSGEQDAAARLSREGENQSEHDAGHSHLDPADPAPSESLLDVTHHARTQTGAGKGAQAEKGLRAVQSSVGRDHDEQ